MKDFFSWIWWILLAIICIIIFIAAFSIGVIEMFQVLWTIIIKIGDGSWIKGLIFLPFATIGLIQVTRGFFAILKKDIPDNIPYDSLSTKSKVLIWLYLICTAAGYYILFEVIQNIA